MVILLAIALLLLFVLLAALLWYAYKCGINTGMSITERKVECYLRELEKYLGSDMKCASAIYYIRCSMSEQRDV